MEMRCIGGIPKMMPLNFFLDNLDVLGGLINKIIIRPHPSEKINKYKVLSPE